ncbi:hypothetical protein OCU04_012346 [Sclerotinia nivalis]|uniref:Uncharacterized protein n=1 Tax=Sclerotinia nivalis TaxID=352851 RepID=A0A9X0AAR1_9HELO|nr:hypothetical protein OCU04_012346 [Sclerotinia nivalis]
MFGLRFSCLVVSGYLISCIINLALQLGTGIVLGNIFGSTKIIMVNQEDELMNCDGMKTPNGPEVSPVENASQRPVCVAHAKPLVHRPAVPEVTVEQSSTLQQPSTLQPLIIQQPSRIRRSYSNLRRVRRQYREHKRRQAHEKIERLKRPARVQPPNKPLEQSDTEEGHLRMELQVAKRYVGWHEKTTAKLFDDIDLELKPFEILEGKLATEVVLLRVREIGVMEEVRKLLVEQATLEAWQEWGRKLMDTADKEWREGEKYKEVMWRGRDWSLDREWDEAIDQACEAAMNKGPWEEAMKESMGKAVEEAKERIVKDRERARERARDRVARRRGKISWRRQWHDEPELDSDDMLGDFSLKIDDAEAEEMDMDMDSPVDMEKEDTGGEVRYPKKLSDSGRMPQDG